MRAWWSVLLVPNSRTHLHMRYACSLLCLEDPIKNNASGPDSLRMASILSPISSIAVSQEIRWYLPFTSFMGYFRRCECSVMPCSRTEAPFAQCAPRLSGESNTGSWPTHTPFCTTASIAQPTEQCVHTVRLTSIPPLAFSSAASALPIMLNGSREARTPAPAATPERLRKARRSIVFASIPERLRDSRLWPEERCAGAPADFLVSIMVTPPRDRLWWCCSSCGRGRFPDTPCRVSYCRLRQAAPRAGLPGWLSRLPLRRRRHRLPAGSFCG